MGSVGHAIILAGGVGSRMLPASLYMPKEAMPLVDTPILNHLIWEASIAGASTIHLVLSKTKKEMLERFLEEGDVYGRDIRPDLPRHSLSLGLDGLEVITHVQDVAGGVADAISVALQRVNGSFLVLLGDMLLQNNHVSPKFAGPEFASVASKRLVEEFEKSGLPCVGIRSVNIDEVSKYGVVEMSENMVRDIVEKPTESEAPSNYILCGRYLLPEDTMQILEEYPISEYGEMQSIMLLRHLMKNNGLKAVDLSEMEMYDSGDPLSWLKSQIDHALRREDLGFQVREWVSKRIQEL